MNIVMLDGSTEAEIKEYVVDVPYKLLLPLNAPAMQSNGNCRIVGIAKKGKIKL